MVNHNRDIGFKFSEVARVDIGDAAIFGAVGGALVSAALAYTDLLAWQKSRSRARREHARSVPIRVFFDPAADILVLITRIGLGAISGLIFHAQVTGAYAAIAVGVSAPLVVAQLGRTARISAKLTTPSKDEKSSKTDPSSTVDATSKVTE